MATDQGQIYVVRAVVVGLIAMTRDEVGQVCMGTVVVSVVSMTTVVRGVRLIAAHFVGFVPLTLLIDSLIVMTTD